MAVNRRGGTRPLHYLPRGSPHCTGDQRRFVEVLSAEGALECGQ